ncbi:hypothetical protein PoHVEF18_001481 [Penicillium ochrochloron]
MAAHMRGAIKAPRRAASPPLCFPPNEFETVPASEVLEEEWFDKFKKRQYYPANIGEVLHSRYQIVGKLGFGGTSTVWLARDLQGHRYVALKIYTRGEGSRNDFEIYKQLDQGPSHPAHDFVRRALDIFTIPRPGGDHSCIVLVPMWESFRAFLDRNPVRRFPVSILRMGLQQIFAALDFLHTECKLVHTDINSSNVLHELKEESLFERFTQAEMQNPSRRKIVNDMPVYASRRFDRQMLHGHAVLGDVDSAVSGEKTWNHDVQPNVYRSPEVMLGTGWSYPIDIWNVGVMAWDLFEGRRLFYGVEPDARGYSTRAHLAEVVALLGPPPLDMLQRGKRSLEFFTEDGK